MSTRKRVLVNTPYFEPTARGILDRHLWLDSEGNGGENE